MRVDFIESVSIIGATHASSIIQTRSRTLWTIWLKSSRREGQQTSFHREDVDSGRSEVVERPYGSYERTTVYRDAVGVRAGLEYNSSYN